MKYMLDTNICVYIIKKKPKNVLENLRAKMHEGISISAITLAELEFGVHNSTHKEKNIIALNQLLVILKILPFDDGAAVEYGKICADLRSRGIPIGQLDMLIAAHAKSRRLIVVTNNTREFSRIEALEIENWVLQGT